MNFILNRTAVSLGLYLSILSATQPGDTLVWKAVNAFYNYETAEAITILDSARIEYPDNPHAHFTWVAARMLHSEANHATENTYSVLSKSLDTVIPVLKMLKNKYPQDPEYGLYLGCAIGLRARVSLGRKQWLSTLVNAYKGFRLIQDVARNNPDIVDAQLPVGIVEYYAGLNPGFIQLGAKLMGIDANRKGGLAKIEKAAAQGEFSWIEAKKIVAFITLWMEDDPRSALLHSRDLREKFPKNYFYDYNCKYIKGECDYIVPANLDLKDEFKIKKYALEGNLVEQIKYSIDNELVSSDIIGSSAPSIYDSNATIVTEDGKNAILYIWYDNEYGYSHQVIRLAKYIAKVRRFTYY